MNKIDDQNLKRNREIVPPKGRLGVLLPGMGAVATTLIAGVHLVKKGLAEPIGSLTQMQKIRIGKRTEPRAIPIKELVPLAELGDLVFGGWDITVGKCL
jgi:myo-inositol-1-phosphate synthase